MEQHVQKILKEIKQKSIGIRDSLGLILIISKISNQPKISKEIIEMSKKAINHKDLQLFIRYLQQKFHTIDRKLEVEELINHKIMLAKATISTQSNMEKSIVYLNLIFYLAKGGQKYNVQTVQGKQIERDEQFENLIKDIISQYNIEDINTLIQIVTGEGNDKIIFKTEKKRGTIIRSNLQTVQYGVVKPTQQQHASQFFFGNSQKMEDQDKSRLVPNNLKNFMFKIANREVLVILFKEKLEKINLCLSKQNKTPIQFVSNTIGPVEYASFLIVLKNTDNLFQILSLQYQCSRKFLGFFSVGSSQRTILLKNKIIWDNQKSVCFLQDDQSKIQNTYKLIALIKSSRIIWGQRKNHSQISQWWEIIQKQFHSTLQKNQLKLDSSFSDILIDIIPQLSKEERQYQKYMLWLLTKISAPILWKTLIYGNVLSKLEVKNIEQIEINKDEGELRSIDLIYLRALYYGAERRQKTEKLLVINFKNQPKQIIKQILLLCTSREFQTHKNIIIKELIDNSWISLQEFIKKYLNLQKKLILNQQHNKKNKFIQFDYIYNVLLNLKNKCIALGKGKQINFMEASLFQEDLTEIFQRKQQNNGMSTAIFRFQGENLVKYITECKQIGIYQPYLSNVMLKITALNMFKISIIPNIYPALFIPPFKYFQILLKKLFNEKKSQIILYIQKQNGRQNLRNIISFIAEYFKQDESLKDIIQQKLNKSSELQGEDIIQLKSLLNTQKIVNIQHVFFFIISDKIIHHLQRNNNQKQIILSHQSANNNIYINYGSAKDMTSLQLKLQSIRESAQSTYLKTSSFEIDQNLTILLLKIKNITAVQYFIAVFSALNIIQTLETDNQTQRKWVYKLCQQFQRVSFEQFTESLTKKIKNSQSISMASIVNILLVASYLYPDKTIDFIQNNSIWNGWRVAKTKLRYRIQPLEQYHQKQKKLSMNVFCWILRSYIAKQMEDRQKNVSTLISIQEAGKKYQEVMRINKNENSKKIIIVYLFKLLHQNHTIMLKLFSEINEKDAFINEIQKNSLFSIHDLRDITLFMIQCSSKNNKSQLSLAMEFIERLIEKSNYEKKSKDHIIEIPIAYQNIQKLFFIPSMLYDQQSHKRFLFDKIDNFKKMYGKLKLIKDKDTYYFINNHIKQIGIHFQIFMQKNFDVILKLIFNNPLDQEITKLKNHLYSRQLTINHINAFLQLIIQAHNSKEAQEFFENYLRNIKLLKINPHNLMKNINNINQKAPQQSKKGLFSIFELLIKTITIDKQNINEFLTASKLLTIGDVFLLIISKICQCYYQLYHKISNTQHKFHQNLLQIFPQVEQQVKIQIILDIYFLILKKNNKCQEIRFEEKVNKFWKALLQNPKQLQLINSCQKKDIKQIQMKVQEKLFLNQVTIGEIKKIKSNKRHIKSKYSSIFTLTCEKYKKVEEIEFNLSKIKSIIQTFPSLQQQKNQINNIISRKEQTSLQQILKFMEDFGQLQEMSIDLQSFKKLQLWGNREIKSKEDLKVQWKSCQQILISLTETIQQMSFKDYQSTFYKLSDECIDHIFKKSRKVSQKIKQFNKQIKQLQVIIDTWKSYQYFKCEVVGENLSQKQKEYSVSVKNFQAQRNGEKQQQYASSIIKSLRSIMNYIEKTINSKSHSGDILTIIKTTFQCKSLFQKIQDTSVDEHKLNSLKQFSNQMQNSIIRPESVMKFRNAYQYWKNVYKSAQITKAFEYIRKTVSLKVNLKECIMDSKGIEVILFQKIDEANDRTNYFRVQVEALLKCSYLRLIMVADKLDVQVVIKDQRFQDNPLDFRRLNSLKEKSLLYDFSIFDEQQQSNLDSLTIYCQLFKEIQAIRRISNQICGYAYKPSKMVSSIDIVNSIFKNITKKKEQLQQLKREWIGSIREICSKSYLFTHFVGQKLNCFIENVKKYAYQPSLRHIINQSQEQFYAQVIMQDKQIILSDSTQNIIDNYRKISQLFKKQQSHMQQELFQSNSILLITSAPTQFYEHMINQNYGSPPRLNQVFYCHEHSSEQQIEFFFFRALIDFSNRYFIVGVTKLNENLKSSLCRMISQLKEQRQAQFLRSNLVFIDDKQSGNMVYSYLSRPKRFSIKKVLSFTVAKERMDELQQILVNNIKNVELVTSARAGLGKTYYVEKKMGDKQLVNHFPISGTIDVKNLSARLKKLSFAKGQALLIKLGHVINRHLLQIFLESIIIFRGFFAEEYIYLPETTKIFIELQNILQPQSLVGEKIPKQYCILHFLQTNSLQNHIQSFNPSLIDFDSASQQDLFVYCYFNLLETNQINQTNIQFLQFKREMAPSKQKNVQLITRYYLSQTNPNLVSFITYSNLMKMLFSIIETFSNNQILRPQFINNKEPILFEMSFSYYRQNFLAVCIQNAICLMQQLQSSHNFKESKEKLRNFRQIKQDIPLLILPDFSREAFKFITLDNERVPNQIKLFNAVQNTDMYKKILGSMRDLPTLNRICKEFSISEMSGDVLKKQIQQVLQTISRDIRYKQPIKVDQLSPENNYVLTLDNFCKMCFIILRERCGIPCIIQGESGVGKTALITYLSKRIFKNQLLILNVHAGIHSQQLQQFVNKMKISAEKIQEQNGIFKHQHQSRTFQKRLWVFLDQYNTCDEYGYIKQMVIEHRFMGQKLPHCIQFIAACNPYRYYETKDYIKTGLRRNRYGRQDRQKQLAFKVNPPPFSMIQLAWNYHQLTQKQNQCYIMSILDSKKIGPQLKQSLARAIVKLHENIKQNVQISAVSLRDVQRVKELYLWFRNYLKKMKMERKQGGYSNPALLALIFCYALRFHNEKIRHNIFHLIEQSMKIVPGTCQKIFEKQQDNFADNILDSKKLQRDKIALNKALKENIFVTFVCVMNKIPVLIVGNPGSSKSLAVNYLASALTGASSQATICKQYPQINMIYFQGSQSSTSAGVQEVFHRAEQYHSQKYINCIYFDEIGLAQMSVHNPLKVLHSWLQIHGKRIASFIGISNHELDASKMSRFLILNRTEPDQQDLVSTAKGIFCQYEQNGLILDNQKTLREIASYYHKFITKNAYENFFGLRDYYNYVKQICKGITKDPFEEGSISISSLSRKSSNIRKHIERAIEINFDGREDSVKKFKSFLPQANNQAINLFKPLQLIQQNLQDNKSRCLLLIVEGDTLMPYIKNALDKGKEKKCVVYYGSAFAEDQKSEEYNYQITNKIISYMAKGNTILFKDPNNSIQSSLYELFNKAYTEFGENKMCRIAVGANSNLQCSVHEDFRAIIVIQSRKVAALNPPFLNRFEKHRLQLETLLESRHKQIFKRMTQWINKITSFNQNGLLKRQNIILNSSQKSLLTLILKHKELDNQDAQHQIKLDLLKNKTTDFIISVISQKSQNYQSLIQQLKYLKIPQFQYLKQDLIIYTYDQYIHLQDIKIRFLQNSHIIRLLEITSQKALKQSLKYGLEREGINKIAIIVDYFKSFEFIQQLLYLAKQLKQQTKNNGKQIIFICQLHRFNLMIPKEDINQSTINISYLHKYQQYFCEDFSTQITKEFGNNELSFFSLLQKVNQFENDFLKSIHLEACTSININFEDQEMNGIQYYQKMNHLAQDKVYWSQLSEFIKPILHTKLRSEDYSIFHNNTNELINCSNIYQITKTIIKSLIKKLILQFLKIIIPNNNFFKLFFDHHRFYSESQQKIRQICKQQLTEILKSHSEKIRQGLQYKLRENDEQVDITILKNLGNLNLKRLFKEIKFQLGKSKIQGIISQEIDKKQQFTYFKTVLQSSLKRNPSLERILIQEAVKPQIICQLLCFVRENNIEKKALSWLTNCFENKCQFETVEYLIYTLLFSEEQQLNPIIQLASIITKHTQANLQSQPIDFSKNNVNDGLKNIGKSILSFTFQLCKLTNYSQFTSAEGMMEYIKQLGENQSIQQLQNLLEFQVSNQYYQILKLIHFCQKNENGSQLFQKFIDLGSNQSIYKNILTFCEIYQMEGGNNHQIEEFLSYSFFQYWISHIVNNSSHLEAKECILKFSNLCNSSIQFANRSHIFFQGVFQFSDFLQEEKESKQRINQVLRQVSAGNQFTNQVSKHLNNNNNFSLALFTYYYRIIQEILSREKNQNILSSTSSIFSKYFSQAVNDANIKNYFKLAFIKKYLSIYVQIIAHKSETYQQTDKALNLMSTIKQQVFIYLNISLRKLLQADQIKERFIDIQRCHWVQENFIQNRGEMKELQRLFMETSSIFLDQRKTYSESLFIHLKCSNQLDKHQILSFFLQNYDKGYGFFLRNISPIFLFLSKIRKMINLRTTRYDLQNQTIQQWINAKSRMNHEEGKELNNQLKQFLQSIEHISKKSFNLKSTSPLSSFVLESQSAQNPKLAIFIEKQIYQYNSICEKLIQLIRAVNPKSSLLKNKSNKINPFSLKSATPLLALPVYEDLQARAVKYSYYSLQKQPCQMRFCIEQIYSSILQNMKKFYLLVSQPKQFLTVKLAGEDITILQSFRKFKLKNLKQLNMQEIVDSFFISQKANDNDNYIKLTQKILHEIQILIKILKRSPKIPEHTIGTEIKKNQFLQINIKQLIKRPFSQIPCEGILSLYQFVQYRSLQNIQIMVGQQFKRQNEGIRKYRQLITDFVQRLKDNQQDLSVPTYDQFKRALYRLIGRKVINKKIIPNERLSKYLCDEQDCWDYDLDIKTSKMIREKEFKNYLQIQIAYLGIILKEVPYNEDKPIPDEPTKATVKKKPNFKKI